MGKKPDKSKEPEQPVLPTFTDEEKESARRCFRKGQELAEKKNYDYAITWYISGLEIWPEAVEEGHKPCRAASLFRGKVKISFGDGRKYKIGDKDPKKAMVNAEMLLSKDPQNVGYMEAMFKSAAKGMYDLTVMWIGEIFADAASREEKLNPARFEVLGVIYEELADRHTVLNPPFAIAALDRAFEARKRLAALKPNDMAVSTAYRDIAGKMTILKGKYSSASSFKDSMQDSDTQRDLHDRDRVVQTDERMDDLVSKAEAQYRDNPTDAATISGLVELLCRREEETGENKAIGVLVKAFKDTDEYRYKMRAEDIRMKQLNRKARQIAASGDAQAAREHLKEQLRFELSVFRERGERYPTDLRIRYEHGKRLFRAGRHDEAIPVLQEARHDPKTRTQCSLYLGRCFFEKAYSAQAMDTFREAINSYEFPDDDLGKQLHYWLGRSHEAAGQTADALKVYGQLIQWEYNYRNGEVRKRIDDLNRPPGKAGGS